MVARLRLSLLVVAEFSLVLGLHVLSRAGGFSIRWRQPVRWLQETALEDIAGGVLLIVAQGLAYWLLVSTIAYLLASLSGRTGAMTAVQSVTLPSIRRLANRVVALSIAASTVGAPAIPAVALISPPPSETVGWDVGETRQTPSPEEEGESGGRLVLPPHLIGGWGGGPGEPAGEEPDIPPPGPEIPEDASRTATVAPGDHLWSISQRHLETVWGRTNLADHEVARYWVQVIEANRTRIRSGNPDLIYPGEVILLPTVAGLP